VRRGSQICYVASGRRPSPHTIQHVLATGPAPRQTWRRYPRFSDILEPAERRLAIVRLHVEGWTVTCIAGYLQTTRRTVYLTLRRWIEEGVPGLDHKPHRRKRLAFKTDLRAIETVRTLQENPELGEFRVHAALLQLGIKLSQQRYLAL
jgi:putative transposase